MDIKTPLQSLSELVAAAGMPSGNLGDVAIAGDDPVLPTRYRIGAAGAASYAAVGLAAAELWALKTGRRQRVSIEARHAAVALRGNRYLRIAGRDPGLDFREPATGFYPVRDGRWIYLHCNFANLRAANLGVIGAPPDPVRIREATRSRDGLELEEAIFAAGGCCGFARTPEEWAAHPHAAAVAGLPLVELVRIGDAPAEPLPAGDRPLSGVRALDLTRVIAGPACARAFAEHGADVLRITRRDLPDSGMLDVDSGFGKRATVLDIRTRDDDARLRTLVRSGDIFCQSYRPGTLARRGFGPEQVAEMRPGAIYVTLSAWGNAGPWRDRRGYDTVVQAANGMASVQGGEGPPKHLPVSAMDYVAGNLMALGALEALRRRATVGGSWLVRVSLVRTGQWISERGILPADRIGGVADDLPAAEIAALCRTLPSVHGELRFLPPVLSMSETPPRLDRALVDIPPEQARWAER